MRVERLVLRAGAGEPAELAARIRSLSPPAPEVKAAVADMIAAVRERGDAAVRELVERHDVHGAPEEFRVPAKWLRQSLRRLDPDLRASLEFAAANVRAVALAEAVARPPVDITLPEGQRIDLLDLPVKRAGAYVPGGRAPYPSSVLMCCIPARVAGVREIAVATPPGEDGRPHPTVLAACAVARVDEVYAIGGAQAIAALVLGTETVAAVDVVVGPGSHWVQEAKRQLAGHVGIDGVAGPSEVFVIADDDSNARQVALDLAAQGEHGPESVLVLATPDDTLVDGVASELERIANEHRTVADAAVALVRVPSIASAVELANAFAPEHLELHCADAQGVAAAIDSSGCIFIGEGGAAFGDYVAGSNHVLPTGGAARFGAPLGVAAFRRRQALVSLPARAASTLAPHVSVLARAEGFPVHAASAEARVAASDELPNA